MPRKRQSPSPAPNFDERRQVVELGVDHTAQVTKWPHTQTLIVEIRCRRRACGFDFTPLLEDLAATCIARLQREEEPTHAQKRPPARG